MPGHPKIKSSILKLWEEINQKLKEYNNELLLFDFTTVTHGSNNKLKIKSEYCNSISGYGELLEDYFKSYGYSIPQANSESIPVLYSIKDYSNPIKCNPIYDVYDPGPSSTTLVELKTWHQFVEEKKIAGASWILFKDFFNDEDTNERIEVGVYILLGNQVNGWHGNIGDDSDVVEIASQGDDINRYLSGVVYKFLFDNGIDYIAQEYKNRKEELELVKYEREQLSREKMLYVGMGHYIKNSMNGLEEHEIEIIGYLNQSAPNEKILWTAQLQRVIYSLIRLYLQIRQISTFGTLANKETVLRNNIQLEDIINLIYLHSIIMKGKFYTALQDDILFEKTKEIIPHQYRLIEKLADILVNENLTQESVDSIFKSAIDISVFHKLLKGGYVTQLNLNHSVSKYLQLTAVQFKYLYTVFVEIFDNCYGSKHLSGSAVTKIYFSNDENDKFHKLIISSRSSSMDIDKYFPFESSELTDEWTARGNGLRIIKSSLDNIYMNSDVKYTKEIKEFRLSNNGVINVFEYHLLLNKNLFS